MTQINGYTSCSSIICAFLMHFSEITHTPRLDRLTGPHQQSLMMQQDTEQCLDVGDPYCDFRELDPDREAHRQWSRSTALERLNRERELMLTRTEADEIYRQYLKQDVRSVRRRS